jgi:hypothetical protein
MFNFSMILYYVTQLVQKYNYNIFMIFTLFTLTLHGRLPVSPLIPCSIKFAQRGFPEFSAFVERIPRAVTLLGEDWKNKSRWLESGVCELERISDGNWSPETDSSTHSTVSVM